MPIDLSRLEVTNPDNLGGSFLKLGHLGIRPSICYVGRHHAVDGEIVKRDNPLLLRSRCATDTLKID